MDSAFGIIAKNSLPSSKSQTFSYMFCLNLLQFYIYIYVCGLLWVDFCIECEMCLDSFFCL